MLSQNRITAVLGPTNTGKTYLAIERMMGHPSGMIGFPLRLLARENYERVVAIKGRHQTALITGEEKILPAGARYFLCTVESMPTDRLVSFLGVDEIQMCADPDRGHVFTDRLLRARGTTETMFMGARTVAPLIRKLVPDAHLESRERFSKLTYSGPAKLARLPRRSAVVAFSATDVYAMAELVRRQRGGAAVVLGALSPRTRNAQVEMFQAGEVDYLVATDAIGMGLNMDINHVAFASLRKFDGRAQRDLTAAEIGQIAGRAGRYENDGTFGTTVDQHHLDPEAVDRIETHSFETVKALNWRNADLNFVSVDALLTSLKKKPERPGLVRAREADDQRSLTLLAKDRELLDLAATPDAVRLLWEVCRIPDFHRSRGDSHWRLQSRIFRLLMDAHGRLPTDWLAGHVARIDKTEGDIDTLVQRLDAIRTWTYVSYRPGWIEDATHWQERTRGIEDKLSDALHERLTKRFVDQRSSVLMKRMRDGKDMEADVDSEGAVSLEGHFVGRLSGFRFIADDTESRHEARALNGAARQSLRAEVARRLATLENDPAAAGLALDDQGTLLWRNDPVARLRKGGDVLSPQLVVLESDLLSAEEAARLQSALSVWLERHLKETLEPLFDLRNAPLEGAAKGLAYQLTEALGSLPRNQAQDQIGVMEKEERVTLRRLGVHIVRDSVYQPKLLRPAAVRLRAILWNLWNDRQPMLTPPAPGLTTLNTDPDVPGDFYEAVGFRVLGSRAARLDIVERLAEMAWNATKTAPGPLTPEMMNLAGCGAEAAAAMFKAMGYRPRAPEEEGGVWILSRKPPRKPRPTPATRSTSDAKPAGEGGEEQARDGTPRKPGKPPRRDKRDGPPRRDAKGQKGGKGGKGPRDAPAGPRNPPRNLEDSPFAALANWKPSSK